MVGAVIWYIRAERDTRRKVVRAWEEKIKEAPELLDYLRGWVSDKTSKAIVKADRMAMGLKRADE
jgi:hypothetical protein